MEKVECGLLRDVSDFLKTISDIAFKAFDRLNELGVFTDDMEKTEDGGFTWAMSTKDKSHKVKCEAIPVADKSNTYDITFRSEKGKTHTIKNVSDKQFYDAFNKAIEVLYGTKIEEWVEASSNLKISLKRIVGEDESTVELCGINTSLPIKSATEIVSNLMVDEFIETIPETETWYEVSEAENDYDVQVIDGSCEVDASTSVYNCLRAAFEALSTCQAVHWNARGEDFFTLHEKLDEYIEKLQENIDELAEIIKQLGVVVPAPAQIYKECTPIDVSNEFDAHAGFIAVNDILTVYCMTLDCYYVNVDHNIQSQFDEILSYWVKETQYKLTSLLN